MNCRINPAVVALVIAATGTGARAAATHEQNDAQVISTAKTSLVQAITTAEQK